MFPLSSLYIQVSLYREEQGDNFKAYAVMIKLHGTRRVPIALVQGVQAKGTEHKLKMSRRKETERAEGALNTALWCLLGFVVLVAMEKGKNLVQGIEAYLGNDRCDRRNAGRDLQQFPISNLFNI